MADVGNSTTLTYRHTLSIFVHIFCMYIYTYIYMTDPLLHGWPANSPLSNGPIGHRIVTMQQIELLPLARAVCSNSNYPTPHIQFTQLRTSIQNPFTNKLLFWEGFAFYREHHIPLEPKSNSVTTTHITIKTYGNVLNVLLALVSWKTFLSIQQQFYSKMDSTSGRQVIIHRLQLCITFYNMNDFPNLTHE